MLSCRHYYVAVASSDLKLSTLLDLLSALQARGSCACVIVCSARDLLDKLVTGLTQTKDTSIAFLPTVTICCNPKFECVGGAANSASAEILITTDACLKAFDDEGHPPLGVTLLVNYELPAKRELLTRRVQVVCGPDSTDSKLSAAIAMYFVTAGEMAQLRAVEGFLGAASLEVMPVHVADILQQTRQSVS